MLTASSPVWAEDWSVVVIGNPSQAASSAFSDSFHMADALKSAGFANVNLYRDQSGENLATVLDAGLGARDVMVYFAGDLRKNEAGTSLVGSDQNASQPALDPYFSRLAQSGTQRVVLLIETCFSGKSTGVVSAPDSFDLEVFVATSGDCTQPRLTDLIVDRVGENTLQDTLAGVTIVTNTGTPIVLNAPATPVIIASSDSGIEIVDQTRRDVVSILPMTMSASNTSIQSVSTAIGVAGPRTSQPATTILPAPAETQLAALPQQSGQPEPSIIVGIIAGQNDFDRVNPDLPQIGTSEISYDNVEGRRALRDGNPELFASLLESGAFDPPAAEIARALQTELARMNCYRSAIDGDWGNLSSGAVDRYFAQAGGNAASRDAVADLFRQIILKDDLRCPTPVVAQPSRPAPQAARPTTSRPVQSQPSAPRPAPAAPKPAPSGGGLGDVNLGGVFRG